MKRTLLALFMVQLAGAVAAGAGPVEDAEPRAVAVLQDAARAPQAQLRMHATEMAQAMPDRALPLMRLAVDDPNPAVRFAALVNVGRLKLDALAERAAELVKDPDEPGYVRAAAAFAAGQNGVAADHAPIITLLWHDEPGQRANAALLLGLSGQRSAIPMLRDAANDEMPRARPVQRELLALQISEAMVRLGSEEELQVIRGLAYSSFGEVRVLAVLTLGRLNDGGMQGNLVTMLARPEVELRLAASEALARLGSAEGLPVMMEAVNRQGEESAAVRAQAAVALGQAMQANPRGGDDDGRRDLWAEARQALVALLDDPDPAVRVAAAAAVLEAADR